MEYSEKELELIAEVALLKQQIKWKDARITQLEERLLTEKFDGEKK
jgi:hypothetical protein